MSYNKSLFEGVPNKNPNKSRFNLSHEYKTQMQPGLLTPILTMETLPGDEWSINSEFMFRFAPLYFPIMHKMTMRADYYYIPNRILWPQYGAASAGNDGWAKWIAEQNETTHPHFTANLTRNTTTFNYHVLAYMGLPLIEAGAGKSALIEELNALPVSAYLKIWDEYYRVPQLENERWFGLDDGDNTTLFESAFGVGVGGLLPVLPSKWEKDYFTSALPTPQIGDAIQIPVVDEELYKGPFEFVNRTTGAPINPGGDGTYVELENTSGGDMQLSSTNAPMALDVQSTAGTIRQLRLAEVLQSYYERIMKVGQRYRDFIKGLWGNDPEPSVIDRPVLLGARFGRVQIADVMTQADTTIGETGTAATGDYRGQANLYSSDNDNITHYCNEHGWIMCILQVNPNTSYGQGIHRMWRRNVQTDYALDMFASIGDQEIAKEEVLYNPFTAQEEKNFETFGYIPRFSEYRYMNNIHTHNLNFDAGLSQHLGRYWDPDNIEGTDYDSAIEINSQFITTRDLELPLQEGDIRLTDVFRVLPSQYVQLPTEGIIYAHIFHSVYVNRNLPMFSTPKL